MQLGGTQREIFDKILNVISPNMAQAVNGSNQIYTDVWDYYMHWVRFIPQIEK